MEGQYGPAAGSYYGGGGAGGGAGGDAPRKFKRKKPLDPTGFIMLHLENRLHYGSFRDQPVLQPQSDYFKYLTPPAANTHSPVQSLPLHHLRTIIVRDKKKERRPVYVAKWDPSGRLLITGNESGFLCYIQGTPIKTIVAHNEAIKCMSWSSNGNYMLTGSKDGYLLVWGKLNPQHAKSMKAHNGEVTAVSFGPGDDKFVTCSEDQSVKIWDTSAVLSPVQVLEEGNMQGHNWDVKCCEWHPYKSLIASCGKDATVRLWDPRTHQSVNTLYAHKSQIFKVAFNKNGRWLVSAGQDSLIKLWDLRMSVKELMTLRGHRREVSSVAWHPIHETLLASGDKEGALMYWITDLSDRPQAEVYGHAKDRAVWDLSWHPLGHVLASVGHDHMAKFWARKRPGDPMPGSAAEYEQVSILGGVKPKGLDKQQAEKATTMADDVAPSSPGSGMLTSTAVGSSLEVVIPGLGKAKLRDRAQVISLGPNAIKSEMMGQRDDGMGGRGMKRSYGETRDGDGEGRGGERGGYYGRPPGPRGPSDGPQVCFGCGKPGHIRRDCPEGGGGGGGGYGGRRGGMRPYP